MNMLRSTSAGTRDRDELLPRLGDDCVGPGYRMNDPRTSERNAGYG
jgi:hypothetical protein